MSEDKLNSDIRDLLSHTDQIWYDKMMRQSNMFCLWIDHLTQCNIINTVDEVLSNSLELL